MMKAVNFLKILLLPILIFGFFIITSIEASAANDFNGIVIPEKGGSRLIGPSVNVQCVSNCYNFRWVGDHFDVKFNSTGTVRIRLSSYPGEYVGCKYEILDRGPDIDNLNDYQIIKTSNGCEASFNAQYTNSWRYGVSFLLQSPAPTPTPTNTPVPTATPTPGVTCTEVGQGDITTPNDYSAWAYYFLPLGNPVEGGRSVGDFNCDGVVDPQDYSVWQNHFSPY